MVNTCPGYSGVSVGEGQKEFLKETSQLFLTSEGEGYG